MAEQSLQTENIEYHLVTLFEKLENIRADSLNSGNHLKVPVKVEIRSLEFWRSVISECLSSFIYVFVVSGAAAGSGVERSLPSILMATALASGFAMTSLTQCFGHISGAHINPAVSLAMGVIKRISILRTLVFIVAQCGGGIAGAAFLYGVTIPGYQGESSAAIIGYSLNITPWERFGIEFILTFIVVFSYFISMDTYRRWTGTSSITIGSTYSACSFIWMPCMNPARSLGPSFVWHSWDNHWVYWLGPLSGGALAGLVYEYIFNPRRHKKIKDSQDDESSSIRSDDIDNFDDVDKSAPAKFTGSNYNTYRSVVGGTSNYCGSLYGGPTSKMERGESIYGGTKSLYCSSPPLTRANLNRSQSVYAKSNSGINKDIIPRPGPLIPTQSMYPLRINQHSHVNQNVQNQLQQRSDGANGGRMASGTIHRPETQNGTERQRDNYSTTERQRCENYSNAEKPRRENLGSENIYGTRSNSTTTENSESKHRGNRPESVYGMLGSRRGQSSGQSDDSCYSSYTATSSTRNAHSSSNNANFIKGQKSNGQCFSGRNCPQPENKPNSNNQHLPVNGSNSSSYHHLHSPNSHY